jgi:probable F420-dependent oxidoreductase
MIVLLDTTLTVRKPTTVANAAREAEAAGVAGIWSEETAHEPFLPLMLAATATERVSLGTGIAVAFARSPMAVAQAAWDLQAASGGRFILGLGTQVRGHIERRFGMPWSAPGPRLREYLLCLRAIFDCWQHGAKPAFAGEHYQFTLMTPIFNPGPLATPWTDASGVAKGVPVWIAGVNDYLCRLAGELCDGFHVHPLHSPKYIAEFVLPRIEAGARRTGRRLADVQRASTAFVITGDTDDELARAERAVRQQIAFYASTPSYRTILDLHGWGDVAGRLTEMSRRGEWQAMADLITDEMLDTFATRGAVGELPALLQQRYEGLLDRVSLYVPHTAAGSADLTHTLARAWSAAAS